MDTYEIVWAIGKFGGFCARLRDKITGKIIDLVWLPSETEEEAEEHFRNNGMLPQTIKPVHAHTDNYKEG